MTRLPLFDSRGLLKNAETKLEMRMPVDSSIKKQRRSLPQHREKSL